MTIIGRRNASLAGLLLALVLVVSPTAAEDIGTVRGITLSTHRGGRELGDPEVLRPSYEAIRTTGANWVAVHPYARIRKDGTVSFRLPDGKPPSYWTEPIRVAHEKGLRVCIKPHLAHWRSGFSWRGEIRFETEEEWDRFWEGYTAWILAMAEACKDADLFVVGTELDKTTHHAGQWRKLIREVRKRTHATLTFASNWDSFEAVPFWDALDLVGIQSYFPISRDADPSEQALQKGWRELAERLAEYSENVGRKVVLTELGYNRSKKAASEPWTYAVDAEMEPLQMRCMTVALKAIEQESAIVGSFLWKRFPEPRPVGRNFQLATEGMRRAIRQVWIANKASGSATDELPGD